MDKLVGWIPDWLYFAFWGVAIVVGLLMFVDAQTPTTTCSGEYAHCDPDD